MIAARLRLRGQTQKEIAQQIGVSQMQVSNDLKVIEGRWQEAARADIGVLKARELARLEDLWQEVWAAWQRSVERGDGDPRYLQQVREVSKSIRELLGLDKLQLEVSGPDGGPIEHELSAPTILAYADYLRDQQAAQDRGEG